MTGCRAAILNFLVEELLAAAVQVAKAVNDCDCGPLANAHFDEEQLDEIRIASWMHDIAKALLPEQRKMKKLQEELKAAAKKLEG